MFNSHTILPANIYAALLHVTGTQRSNEHPAMNLTNAALIRESDYFFVQVIVFLYVSKPTSPM